MATKKPKGLGLGLEALLGPQVRDDAPARDDARAVDMNEQADLLDIVWTQMFAKGLAHRMGAGLGHRDKDIAVQMGNDHGRTGGCARIIAQPAGTPPGMRQPCRMFALDEPEIVVG